MNENALEQIHDLLAGAIDEVPAAKETLFLAKLCLVLAVACEDIGTVREAIATARSNLD